MMQFFKKVIESLVFGCFGGYTDCMGITNQSHRGASPNDHLLAPLYECRLIVREGGAAYSDNIAPRTIADTLHKFYEGFDREVFSVVLLDVRMQLIGISIVAVGALDRVSLSVANVFKPAILANADSIIIAHNHPSGVTDPSPTDISTFVDIIAAGRLLDVPVRDSVILGHRAEDAWVLSLSNQWALLSGGGNKDAAASAATGGGGQ